MEVRWTYHALERTQQRFPGEGWRQVPFEKIIQSAEGIELDELVKVRQGKVVYFVRKKPDYLLIVTVIDAKEKKRIRSVRKSQAIIDRMQAKK